MERPEGQAKTIRSRKSGAFVKPSHGEHKKVRSKMDRTLHGVRENEVRHLQAIIHLMKCPGALLEHREPLPFLHLNKNCKQKSHDL
jgi:hypothetical protein